MKQTNSFKVMGDKQSFTVSNWLFLVVFLLMSFTSFAQIAIQGTVSDPNGIPIAGASVLVKNSSNGVVTDFDGKFQLTVASGDAVLSVSYIGFEIYEVAVGTKTDFDIVLKENLQELDEVVVIG